MASEIRVNKIENRSGLGTVTFADTGVDLAGIVTATTFSGSGASLTALPAAQVTGTLPAISGANLTALNGSNIASGTVADARISTLTASKLSGALPAISAANLTNVPAANVVGVHTSLTVTNATTTGTAVVGGGVTISESGIEASGIGITCANINGTQIGGRRNIIINGAMMVAQRGTSSTSSGYQTVDRFSTSVGGTDEAPTQAQVDLSSSDTPYSLGFRKAIKLTNGNQTSGGGAGDYLSIVSKLEAQDIANSGWNYTDSSSNITMSFWAKSSVAKTFILSLYTQDGTDYAYNHKYALAANTWTKITHTFPGNSNLTFDNDNGLGIQFQWIMYFGTTYTSGSTVDQWVTYGGYTSTPDDTNDWYVQNDATFELTGVQLEVGSQATAFEQRSFGEELELCKRYYQQSYPYGLAYPGQTSYTNGNEVFHIDDGNIQRHMVRLHKTMRGASATVVIYNPNTGASDSVRTNDGANHNPSGAYDIGNNSFFMDVTPSSGEFVSFHWTANAEL